MAEWENLRKRYLGIKKRKTPLNIDKKEKIDLLHP